MKKKKCSRERCVQPTAAGRIRPTFLLTTLISVRLSTYSVCVYYCLTWERPTILQAVVDATTPFFFFTSQSRVVMKRLEKKKK